MTEPIENIVWIPSRDLKANGWNPNVVFDPELKLIEESILRDGWCQALTVNTNNIIIDGFHRWRLSMDSPELQARYAEEVPCVVMDIPDAEAMLMTVRINRAKGTHVAVRMSELVRIVAEEHGYTTEEICRAIGATRAEVELLLKGGVFKNRDISSYRYSNAWVPVEVSAQERQKMLNDGSGGGDITPERADDETTQV